MDVLTIILYFLFPLLLLYIFSRLYLYKCAIKIIGLKGNILCLPIIGDAHHFLKKDFLQHSMQLINKRINSKTGVGLWVGNKLTVFIWTPEDIKIVLNSQNALERPYTYSFAKLFMGDAINVTNNILKWKLNRKLIATTFNQKQLNSYVEVFERNSRKLVDNLTKYVGKEEFDVYYHLFCSAIDVVTETILDVQLNKEECEKFKSWLDTASELTFDRMLKPWLHPDFIFFNTKQGKKSKEICNHFAKFIKEIIHTKRKENISDNKQEIYNEGRVLESSLDALVQASDQITDQQIVDECMSLFVGGTDSNSLTLCFALVMVGMHQDVQNLIYKEQLGVFGDSERNLELEDLSKMNYLERVLKETMRLFPFGPIIGRQATANIKMDNYAIPKGCEIYIHIMATHRNENYWKDASKFDPDRFLSENMINSGAYLPFSIGPRNCIGSKYAMMAMKCTLSTLIRRYRFYSSFKSVSEVPIKMDAFLRPAATKLVSIEAR